MGAATWAAASLGGPSTGPFIGGLQRSHVSQGPQGRGPRGCGHAKCPPRAGQSGRVGGRLAGAPQPVAAAACPAARLPRHAGPSRAVSPRCRGPRGSPALDGAYQQVPPASPASGTQDAWGRPRRRGRQVRWRPVAPEFRASLESVLVSCPQLRWAHVPMTLGEVPGARWATSGSDVGAQCGSGACPSATSPTKGKRPSPPAGHLDVLTASPGVAGEPRSLPPAPLFCSLL